jgi:light-regulated signal transduction histidine kinase (bacteriophytochrome)
VDLGALAREIVGELEAAQSERKVEFRAQEGLVSEGDAGLLRVVLENLLGNAWEFTGNRPCAKIEFGATTESGARRFFVRDNGVGLDEARPHDLFAPFERAHEADDFWGTGIGLATVKRIIERHGGRVWAEGAVGDGATFWFEL